MNLSPILSSLLPPIKPPLCLPMLCLVKRWPYIIYPTCNLGMRGEGGNFVLLRNQMDAVYLLTWRLLALLPFLVDAGVMTAVLISRLREVAFRSRKWKTALLAWIVNSVCRLRINAWKLWCSCSLAMGSHWSSLWNFSIFETSSLLGDCAEYVLCCGRKMSEWNLKLGDHARALSDAEDALEIYQMLQSSLEVKAGDHAGA